MRLLFLLLILWIGLRLIYRIPILGTQVRKKVTEAKMRVLGFAMRAIAFILSQ